MTAYYNEIDPYAAEWLHRLMIEGMIAPGYVDTRSIEDVTPNDLAGYTQCHFFAGIGVWSYALRLAGWPDDRPVWTGSCPCQPFSAAGKGGGFADERHLWPAWFHLITQCQPATLFGEQVASPAGLGWFDLVSADLEASNYAIGAVDTCAAGVGAPHIRQRLYWCALGDTSDAGLPERVGLGGLLGGSVGTDAREALERTGVHLSPLEHPGRIGRQRRETPAPWNVYDRKASEREENKHGLGIAVSHWSAAEWLTCRDGKARPVEPGTFPLAHGAPARVGRLRAYGNAIVAPLAAEFIDAYLGV